MLWLNIGLASCHSAQLQPSWCHHVFFYTHSVSQIHLEGLHPHFLSLNLSLTPLILSVLLCEAHLPTDVLGHKPFYSCVMFLLLCLEMLSLSGEEEIPDLVTVMRNLSTDSGMPPLPPGGGLASK